LKKDAVRRTKSQGEWAVWTPLSHIVEPMSDRAWRLLALLEGAARKRAFCFLSNATISRRLRKDPRTIQAILDEMEKTSWIERVFTVSGRPERAGIILLRRADPNLPVANTPERLEMARAEVLKRWAARSKGDENTTLRVKKSPPQVSQSEEGDVTLSAIEEGAPPSLDDNSHDDVRQSALDAIEGVVSPSGPRRLAVQRAAREFSTALVDVDSLQRYLRLFWELARGKRKAEPIEGAFCTTYDNVAERAIDCPGAYFFRTLEGWGVREMTDEDLFEGAVVSFPAPSTN
jgi:hypothetical protein